MWAVLVCALAVLAALDLASPQHARVAAPFSLRTTGYEDGVQGEPRTVSLADYRGRVLVLDLMAVSCEACRVQVAQVLRPLWDVHGRDARFAMLSVDTWADPATWGSGLADVAVGIETESALVGHQRELGLAWPHALDTDGVWRSYDAVALPRLVVVAPDGHMALDAHGLSALPDVERAVAASLSQVRP
jgi:hypothetical protein